MRIKGKKTADGRGPPPKPWHTYCDRQLFIYIVNISQKYKIAPEQFLKKIFDARENENAICKTLTIQCREKADDYAVFRISRGESLVSQFRIPNYFIGMDFLKSVPASSLK